VDNGEVRELLRRCHAGETRARESLVEAFAPMVRQVARRFAGRGEPLDDLFQVGMVGLLKAVDRFDRDRGVRFSTYAFPSVVGEIKRHFRDRVWAVRVPRPVKDLANRLPQETARLTIFSAVPRPSANSQTRSIRTKKPYSRPLTPGTPTARQASVQDQPTKTMRVTCLIDWVKRKADTSAQRTGLRYVQASPLLMRANGRSSSSPLPAA
jgi:RNA polymerase sigma factor (sigma-70 family)